MTYELTPDGKLVSRRRRWAEVLLVIGFFVSLVVALGALAGLYLLRGNEEAAPAVDPIQALDPSQIPPHLALLQLTDAPAPALAWQAIRANELALAYATIQFDARMENGQRASLLLLLGQGYRGSQASERASLSYRLVRTVAVLAGDLPPLERGRFLVQSGEGLALVDEPEEAVATALQAQLVASRAPGLLPAQRDEILARVEAILRQHGTPEQLRAVRELRRGPLLQPGGVALVSQWAHLQEPASLDPILDEVVANRKAAVGALLQRIQLTAGQDVEPEREAVRAALTVEDRVRRDVIGQALSTGPALAQQHWLLQELRAWQALKLRVALGGFGLRLVPEWEQDVEGIRQELRRTTEQLAVVLEAQVNSQDDPVLRGMLRIEVLRWLALQGELGLYPAAPFPDLAARLAAAQTELANLGAPLALPLTYRPEEQLPRFRYAP